MNVVDTAYQEIQRIHRNSEKEKLAGIPMDASKILEIKLRDLFTSRQRATKEAVRDVYSRYGS